MPNTVYKRRSLRVIKFLDPERGESIQIWVSGHATALTLAEFKEMVEAVEK